jgi:hypothetical protein
MDGVETNIIIMWVDPTLTTPDQVEVFFSLLIIKFFFKVFIKITTFCYKNRDRHPDPGYFYSLLETETLYFIYYILDFSLLPLVKLSFLILFASFFVSVLCLFFGGSLSKVIALPTIAIVVALKVDSKKFSVTFR